MLLKMNRDPSSFFNRFQGDALCTELLVLFRSTLSGKDTILCEYVVSCLQVLCQGEASTNPLLL